MKSNLSKHLFNSLLQRNPKSFATFTKKALISTQLKNLSQISPTHLQPKTFHQLINKQKSAFSIQKKDPLKPEDVPQQNLQIAVTQAKVEDEQVEVFHTKGTLSILDKVPGPKNPQTGQLYVLMFTCGQCNAKQIKSFTKNAYHKGVVLVRCVGCDKVHLVADNLGWFEDEPTNVETLHEGKVQKVHDRAAINAFLQKAFSEEETLLTQQNKTQEQQSQQTQKPQK